MSFGIHALENRNWTFKQNVTVEGDFTFGNAATDDLTVAGDQIINDDRYLHFGTDEDVSIEYDEDGLNILLVTGDGVRFGNASFTVYSADAGATGPEITLQHESASPAASDIVGRIDFNGEDAGGAATDYARIDGAIVATTAGSEEGSLTIRCAESTAGALATVAVFTHDASNGVLTIGDGAASGIIESSGNFDLQLQTGNATTGTITITDGADGAITLAPNGDGQVVVSGGFVTGETTTSSGAGAVAITGSIHEVTSTGANALTLADGTEGQHLFVVYVAEGAGGDVATLTPTNLAGANTTVTFNDLGDSAHLLFTAGAWYFVGGEAAVA